MRNHHMLILTDDEFAHVLACLGRVDDAGGFPNPMAFYAKIQKKASANVKLKFDEYYRNMTFSRPRKQRSY